MDRNRREFMRSLGAAALATGAGGSLGPSREPEERQKPAYEVVVPDTLDLAERAAFARVARWAGFRVTAAWIEEEQNRAAWEQGILHGFRVEKEERHGKRRRNRS